jgi:hypothetical protein
MEYLDRLRSLIGEDGVKKMQEPVVAIGGLGGVGAPIYLNLLRMGVRKFKLAENGIFNAPDMNRQPGAFISTLNKPKVDVYYDMARDINPDVEIEVFPDGVSMDNIEGFIQGSDLFVRAFNFNAENMGMDQALIRILPENKCVCFVSFLLGFGTLMYNYRPGEMPLLEAVKRMAQASAGKMIAGMFPAKLFDLFNPAVMKNVKAYVEINKDFPSSASSAQLAGSLLATEMALYLLRDTELASREAVFAPRFVTLDFFDQSLKVHDITRL